VYDPHNFRIYKSELKNEVIVSLNAEKPGEYRFEFLAENDVSVTFALMIVNSENDHN